MTLHHTKHHQTYVNGLNAAEKQYASSVSPKERIALQAALKFNGGGALSVTSLSYALLIWALILQDTSTTRCSGRTSHPPLTRIRDMVAFLSRALLRTRLTATSVVFRTCKLSLTRRRQLFRAVGGAGW